MGENKLSNHPYLNIKNPQSHVLLIYSCHWLEGIFVMETGSIDIGPFSHPPANERQVNEYV